MGGGPGSRRPPDPRRERARIGERLCRKLGGTSHDASAARLVLTYLCDDPAVPLAQLSRLEGQLTDDVCAHGTHGVLMGVVEQCVDEPHLWSAIDKIVAAAQTGPLTAILFGHLRPTPAPGATVATNTDVAQWIRQGYLQQVYDAPVA